MLHYELMKVYPNGDEDTGLEPGYRDGVMQASGRLQDVIQMAEEQFGDELYPGEVELEIIEATSGVVMAHLVSPPCRGLQNALSRGL